GRPPHCDVRALHPRSGADVFASRPDAVSARACSAAAVSIVHKCASHQLV
ncbi:MAG: hypothetical protein AVDCRST_MAG71-1445, partial [uncultured Lysobacter sp.]